MPCRETELATAGSSPPPEQFATQWRNALAAKILEALPHPIYIASNSHYSRNQITSDIVKLVLSAVKDADELMAEVYERLAEREDLYQRARADASNARDAATQMTEELLRRTELLDSANAGRELLRKSLDDLLATHDQLIRDYNERCAEQTTTKIENERLARLYNERTDAELALRIENERLRDELHNLTINATAKD